MPLLVQFGDLTSEHFAAHSVWAACHSFDYDEPWYGDTDEATFRPWDGALPVDPNDGMFLVRAAFRLADGTELPGFATPADGNGAEQTLGLIQPHVFLPDGQQLGFWLGMFGEPRAEADALYAALAKDAAAVFPISFDLPGALSAGISGGRITGFYTVPDGADVRVTQ
jgi:hypothetical protein